MSRWLTLVLLAAEPVGGEVLRGVVHDPQGAPIAGTAVRIRCGGFESVVATSSDGTFAVSLPERRDTCSTEVRRPGFAPSHQRLVRGTRSQIQLQLARREEEVSVSAARQPDSSHIAPPLGSISFTPDDLAALAPDPNAWVQASILAAGVFAGPTRLSVDGLPQVEAPATAAIARIVVNGDPFSSENGSLDGAGVEIALAEPERSWRFSATGLSLGPAGSETIGDHKERKVRRRGLSLSGPVPRLPLVAFFQAGSYDEARQLAYVRPGDTGVSLEQSAEASSRFNSLAAGVTWTTGRLSLRGAVRQSDTALQNAGVGGLTAPAGASSLSSRRRAYETSWRRTSRTLSHRGGFQFVESQNAMHANSATRRLVIAGQVVDGGDEVATESRARTGWYFKHVLEARSAHPWIAGFEATGDRLSASREFNPRGTLRLDGPGAATGTWVARQGSPAAAIATSTAAAFADVEPWKGRHAVVRAGLRTEWQRGAGVSLSPRLAAQSSFRGFLLALGAGRFVAPWTPEFLSEAALRDALLTSTSFSSDASVGEEAPFPATAPLRLQMTRTPGLQRRRDGVARFSLRRGLGHATFGIEQTWTRGEGLPGLSRSRSSLGLFDVLGSDRRLRRQQTHLTAALRLARLSLNAHYERVRSEDDSDGAFAPPQTADSRPGDWGPSTGIAHHNLSLVATATLPATIRASVIAAAASGLPYSPITGLDPAGLFTYVDRSGLRRNASLGPPSRTVSLHLSRRLVLPRSRHAVLEIGLRVENLFDQTNAEEVLTLQGPRLGRTLRASPGRSARLWISASR